MIYIVTALALVLAIALINSRNKKQRQPPMVLVPWYVPYSLIYQTYQVISGNSAYLDATIKQVGSFFRIKSFLGMNYMATGPDMYRQIWKGRVFEGVLPATWFDLLGHNSISGLQGTKHSRMRRLFSPAFSIESLNSYMPLSQVCTTRYLAELVKLGQLDFYTVAKQYTLDIILNFTFSKDSTQDARFNELNGDFTELIKGFGSLVHLNVPGTQFYKSMKARQRIMNVFAELLKERRKSESEEYNDILAKLMLSRDENGDGMSDHEIVESLITIVFAGHDTSTASICTGLVIIDGIAQKQDVSKLKAEILGKFPLSRDITQDFISYQELNELKFLEQWVKESMRLKGPIPGFLRQATQDVTLQCPMAGGVEEFDVKKGETMTLDYQRVMLSSKYYDKPNEFLPDRSFDDCPYVPFGGGLRVCVGRELAKMEIKLFLVNVLRSYQVEVVSYEQVNFPMKFMKPIVRFVPM